MTSAHRATSLAALCLVLGCNEPPGDGELARGVIGPDGGTITSADSVLTIAIFPGALEETVELFIETTNEPPEVFGQAYIVRPTPELLVDATITIRADLPDDPSTVAVGAVDPDAFEAGQGGWEPLPVLRVDQEQQLVVGLDDRISIFYALLDEAPSSTTTSSGTTTTSDGDATATGGSDDDGTTGDGGESTGPEPATDDGGTTDGGSSGEPAVSFAMEVQPILTANCDCHTAGAPFPAELDLADGYANLVGVASTQAAGLDRIEPGVPDDSYLWLKLQGTHAAAGGTGNPMPAPAGGLDAGSLATIEAWILDGAEP